VQFATSASSLAIAGEPVRVPSPLVVPPNPPLPPAPIVPPALVPAVPPLVPAVPPLRATGAATTARGTARAASDGRDTASADYLRPPRKPRGSGSARAAGVRA